MVAIDGKCHIGPGLRVTTAPTSPKFSLEINKVGHDIHGLAALVGDTRVSHL